MKSIRTRTAAPNRGPAEMPIENDLIFDIGMNSCEDSDFYLAKGFRVVAVEANARACELAAERYEAEISRGQFSIVNRAISADGGPLLFYVCETNPAWSTASGKLRDFWHRRGAVFTESVVAGVTPTALVASYGLPYAKIDVEGSDLACLQDFDRNGAAPKYLSFEADFYAVHEMIACAIALGYQEFALISQTSVPGQRPPSPAAEGTQVDYRFPLGSSGLFGRELPANWVSEKTVRSECDAVIRQYRGSAFVGHFGHVLPKRTVASFQQKFFPLACSWYDIHAAKRGRATVERRHTPMSAGVGAELRKLAGSATASAL
jgi:FkbM family methyltransferase